MEGSSTAAGECSSSNSAVSVLSSAHSEPVKVYIRIRPPEIPCNDSSAALKVIGPDQVQVHHQNTWGEKVFRFDRIFGPAASQVEVYEHTVQPLVHKFYDGINCTIFVYGQTGSGKTYTIGSGCYYGEQREGIIGRTIEDIFKEVEDSSSSSAGSCLLRVSYLEIYKEELRDLLQDSVYPSTKDINIREDDNGRTVISGIVEEEVRCVEDALGWLECGNAARVTTATDMNTHSSRSHAVFTISMVQEKCLECNETTVTTRLSSKFHFVDLAGSERVSRTNNTGVRFKESIHINSGLLALGNVISAFADKRRRSSHVPYRDSKITRILKDSLGGSALTVMITCLSPLSIDVPETLNALKYAKRARNIRNHPIINQANDKDTSLLLSMREEIETLRNELNMAREPRPFGTPTHSHKVDRSIMVELGNQSLYVSYLKRKLQMMTDCQRGIYGELQSVLANGIDCNEDMIEKLYNTIKTNMAACNQVQGSEEFDVVSKSTNTSFDGVSHCAFESMTELKHQLQLAEAKVASTDEKCLTYVTELEKLREQCQHLVENESCLHQEIDQLRNEMESLKSNHKKQTVESMAEPVNNNNILDVDYVYSKLHGTVSNLQEYNEASCDTLLRELVDILSSSSHGSQHVHVHDCLMNELSEEENEINKLQESVTTSEYQLHHTEKRLLNAHLSMKSLNVQIRFKEELIKELVKNNKTFQSLNKAYQVKIFNLEKEQEQLKNHIMKQKSSLKESSDTVKQSSSSGQQSITSKDNSQSSSGLSMSRAKRRKTKSAIVSGRVELEAQEKKLKETESKLALLQRRRQDTLRMLNMGEKSDRRIVELEGEMERLKEHQVAMKRKLKVEYTKKRNLEEEVQQYKRQIKSLTESNKQQSQVIRVKTGEVALAQRKLRGYNPTTPTKNQSISQKWIDREIENIMKQRQALEIFQKELVEREIVIKNKECLLQERHDLERRQSIVSTAAAAAGGERLSQEMEIISQRLITKEKLKASFSGHSLNTLQREIDELRTKQTELAEDLDKSTMNLSFTGISKDEETRLLEITEQIEVLESLLKIKNPSEPDLSSKLYSGNHLHDITTKISTISCDEAKSLLLAYIGKVITLRQYIEHCKTSEKELKKLLKEKDKVVEELEKSLDQSQVDKDLRLTRLRKEHAKEVQLLLDQVQDKQTDESLQSKVKELEKDLYYYKKVTRELKQQLKPKSHQQVVQYAHCAVQQVEDHHQLQPLVTDSLES